MIKQIKNVLIVTNFSDSSTNSVEAGIAMCRRHQASLHLLHVRPKNRFNPPGKNARLIEEVLAAYTSELERMELRARSIQEEKGVPCYFHIADGPFWRGISVTAEDFNCDLIILEKRIDRHYPASGTSLLCRILQEVKCPVLTLPGKNEHLQFKKILIPMKASYADLQKLEIALPIIQKNRSDVFLFGSIRTQTEVRDVLLINKLLNTAGYLIQKNKVLVERETYLAKSLAKQVLSKAAEKHSDLIIMTNKPQAGIKNWFSQSTMERVIAGSSIPVLTVKVGGRLAEII